MKEFRDDLIQKKNFLLLILERLSADEKGDGNGSL